jgi:hypothetical protein
LDLWWWGSRICEVPRWRFCSLLYNFRIIWESLRRLRSERQIDWRIVWFALILASFFKK